MPDRTETMKVWDPLVRIGHWLLVTAFFVAYFTEDELLTQHVWAGYTVAGVVLFRILWGFVGSEHARFRDFVRSPGVTARYLADVVRSREQRFVGHNPAGGAMIMVLLACLMVTTFSGLEIYAIEEAAGPLAGFAAGASEDQEDERGSHDGNREGEEEFWEEVHEVSANLTLFLVILHVGGVILASVTHRENLVRAMISGRKRV